MALHTTRWTISQCHRRDGDFHVRYKDQDIHSRLLSIVADGND